METQSHWFFGTMSPDIIATVFQTGASFAAGLAFAILWGIVAGGGRK